MRAVVGNSRKCMIRVHDRVMAEFTRLKTEHRGATSDTVLLHLILEHDVAQDAREAKLSGKRPIRRVIRVKELDDEARRIGKEEWFKRHGTPAENKKIMGMISGSPGAVRLYVPRFGPGRPKGAKNLKPREKRQIKQPLEKEKVASNV